MSNTLTDNSKKLPVADNNKPSRRSFLKNAALIGSGSLLTADQLFAKEYGKNTPPMVPEWMQKTGRGVVTVPYGMPSKHESGNVRRTV